MSALKTTVRPALRIVAASASGAVAVLRRLLAPAGDDEERVVDREAEAEARHEVEREDRERMHLDRDPQPEERKPDRPRADEWREERGHEAAEDPEREQEHERERDQLGATQVALDRIRDLAGRDRTAAETHVRIAGERRDEPVGRVFRRAAAPRVEEAEDDTVTVDDRPRDGRIAPDPRPHPLHLRRPPGDEGERPGSASTPVRRSTSRFASRLSEERSANWVAPASRRGITVLPSGEGDGHEDGPRASVTARARVGDQVQHRTQREAAEAPGARTRAPRPGRLGPSG